VTAGKEWAAESPAAGLPTSYHQTGWDHEGQASGNPGTVWPRRRPYPYPDLSRDPAGTGLRP